MADDAQELFFRARENPTQPVLPFQNGPETITSYMLRKYGLGDIPAKRKRLYSRMQTAFTLEPRLLLALLVECEAASLEVPEAVRTRYVCAAIAGKMRDHAKALRLVTDADIKRFGGSVKDADIQ